MSNLRQNGGRNELIATVCNQGGKMTTSQTATIRISNGSYATTRAFVSQLNQGGCTDVTIPFGSLQLNYSGRSYLLGADLDFYNNISETREDNNMSYWGIVIN